MVHNSFTLPPLFLATQNGGPFVHIRFEGKCNGFSILIRCVCLLAGRSESALLNELMKILVELLFIFEGEGDIFASLGNLVDGHDLPPPQQLLNSFRLGMHCG